MSKVIKGYSDEVTTCECCGRTGLKGTVIVGTLECEAYYGSVCASRYVGGPGTKRHGDKLISEGVNANGRKAFLIERFARLWAAEESRRGEDKSAWLGWLTLNKGATGPDFVRLLKETADELSTLM